MCLHAYLVHEMEFLEGDSPSQGQCLQETLFILRLPPGGHLTMATPAILSAFQTERREKEGKRCLSMEINSFKEHYQKLYQMVPSSYIYLFKIHLFCRRG